jgi:hypothetical protein
VWPRRRAQYRGIAPLTAGGKRMSRREYEQWRDASTWNPARDAAGLQIQDDLSQASWIEPLLAAGSFEVRMLTPQGFEEYARIFFPFSVVDAEAHGQDGDEPEMTWAEMAARNGKVRHALMEAETIAGDTAGEPWSSACTDRFGRKQLDALMPVLASHTSSKACWYLFWDGWGLISEQAFSGKPKLSHPMRDYYLLRGPLAAYREFPDAPSYCWPEDRAWCLTGDVDLSWSYLAAAASCISDVVLVPVIDAIRTRPDNPARSGMDVINDPDGLVPRSP